MKRFFLHIILLALVFSCDNLVTKDSTRSSRSQIIASVGTSELTKAELSGLIQEGASSEDSTRIVQKYIESWIKKELLTQRASNDLNIDISEIEKKVADYRYTLLSYEYQRIYINQNLDTVVNNEEIETYFEEHKDNFSLKQNIFRGKYLKVAQDAPRKAAIRRWIKSNRPQDLERLQEYAFQYANDYSLSDSAWINLDDITRVSPFSRIENKTQFIRRTNYAEEADSTYLYLLKIDEYKLSDEISPLVFVKDDIKNIILNSRKLTLAKGLENRIFEGAKENEDYKIYR